MYWKLDKLEDLEDTCFYNMNFFQKLKNKNKFGIIHSNQRIKN